MDDLRIGEVTQVFPDEGKVRVMYEDDDNSTLKLPLLTFNGEYMMPKKGDTVLTVHRHSGSCEGFVLGKYYSEDCEVNADPDDGDVFRKDITKKVFILVDEDHVMTVKMQKLKVEGKNVKAILDHEDGSLIETKDLTVKSKSGALKIIGQGTTDIKSTGVMTIKGDSTVGMKSDEAMSLEGGSVSISASGDINLSGGGKSESFSNLIARIEALEEAIQNMG